MNTLLVPKAGSSLLAHCEYLRQFKTEFKHEVDHLVHVALADAGHLWFTDYAKLPKSEYKTFMVWREPGKRIESAVRMFMDKTTDKEFKEKWWAQWIPGYSPFSVLGMRMAVSEGLRGTFKERHFQPYMRLLMSDNLVPRLLVPIEHLEEFLRRNKIVLPEQTHRNEASEYAKSIDMAPFRDLIADVERLDTAVWRKYCGGHGYEIYDESWSV